MLRQLRALDRLDAGVGSTRRRRRVSVAERLRGLLSVTVALAVLAVVGWHYGLGRGLGGGPEDGRSPEDALATTDGTVRFLAHQPGAPDQPVTYDRCRGIEVRLNPAGGPEIGEELTEEAVRVVSRASGLRMRYAGRTDRRPDDRRFANPFGRGGPPRVLVSFTTAEEEPGLAGRVAGLGGSSRTRDALGRSTYVGGQVTLDSEAFAHVLARPGGRDQAEAIVLHEFGHVLGLDHVEDPGELMNADNLGRTTFGPGDRRGLAVLGRGPCTGA